MQNLKWVKIMFPEMIKLITEAKLMICSISSPLGYQIGHLQGYGAHLHMVITQVKHIVICWGRLIQKNKVDKNIQTHTSHTCVSMLKRKNIFSQIARFCTNLSCTCFKSTYYTCFPKSYKFRQVSQEGFSDINIDKHE